LADFLQTLLIKKMKPFRKITIWIVCAWVGFSFVGCASAPAHKDNTKTNQSKPVDTNSSSDGY
jgi:hypothetical protein